MFITKSCLSCYRTLDATYFITLGEWTRLAYVAVCLCVCVCLRVSRLCPIRSHCFLTQYMTTHSHVRWRLISKLLKIAIRLVWLHIQLYLDYKIIVWVRFIGRLKFYQLFLSYASTASTRCTFQYLPTEQKNSFIVKIQMQWVCTCTRTASWACDEKTSGRFLKSQEAKQALEWACTCREGSSNLLSSV